MSTILILLILIGLVLYGLQEYFQIRLGIRPRQTPESVINHLVFMLQDMSETGSFIDLGSAYGATVFGLAKRLPGWELVGIERSPTPWILSQLRSVGKNFGNYRFYMEDAALVPLRNYDVVFMDQNTTIAKRWESGLARRLQPGTLLISLNAPLPRIRPINKVTIDNGQVLYLYQKQVAAEVTPDQILAQTAQQVAEEAPPVPAEPLPQYEQPTSPTPPGETTPNSQV
jgi:predicted O-methyltransferase YrrM